MSISRQLFFPFNLLCLPLNTSLNIDFQMYVLSQILIYIKFLIQWCIVCLYYGKLFFLLRDTHQKYTIMDFCFVQAPQGRLSLGLSWFWSGVSGWRSMPNLVLYSKFVQCSENFVIMLLTIKYQVLGRFFINMHYSNDKWRRIYDRVKHISWSFFVNTINSYRLSTIFAKKLYQRCWQGCKNTSNDFLKFP